MSDRFIIELESEPAGIVVRDGGAFRFYAAARAFDRLEGRLFNTPRDAHRAAARHQTASEPRSACGRPAHGQRRSAPSAGPEPES